MFKIFKSIDKNFSSNGDIVISPLKAKLHKEDNGEYYLQFECPVDYVNFIIEGNIIVAPTPQGQQAFRITSPQKKQNKIVVKAYHVFYDSKNYLIADSYVVDKNGADALAHLNAATMPESPFTTSSDILTVDSFRCVRKSLYEAIKTVVERWGGHLVRNNFSISLQNEIGQDNGVTIRYAKNLNDITCTEKWDNVVTRLLPVGKNGTLLNALDPEASIWVDAPVQYDIPYCKTVTFKQDNIKDEDYTDDEGNVDEERLKADIVADLQNVSRAYADTHYLPEINYTLKADIDRISDVGDTIEVIDERLGISLLTHIISFDYDCILKKYTQVQFGNFKETLSGAVNSVASVSSNQVKEETQSQIDALNVRVNAGNTQLIAMMSNNYVIYNGESILVVDKLPKESAVNVLKIDQKGLSFSNTGIDGDYMLAWDISGALDVSAISGNNLTANMIKGGDLLRGSISNSLGAIKLFDGAGRLFLNADKDGAILSALDGSQLTLDSSGVTIYDSNDSVIFSASSDVFIKKAAIDSELKIGGVKIVKQDVTLNSSVVNSGVGIYADYL